MGVLGRRGDRNPHGCHRPGRPYRQGLRCSRLGRLRGKFPCPPNVSHLISANHPDAGRALTAVIYGTDRTKFGTPEAALQGQRLCVTGFVSFFRQRPEMILSDPGQLSFVAPESVAELR